MLPRARFERLVRRALDGLPPFFRARLDTVDVIVETRPRARHLRHAGLRWGETLLGLYVGVPLTERTSGYNLMLPDRIFIFQEPIESIASNAPELVAQVRATVI